MNVIAILSLLKLSNGASPTSSFGGEDFYFNWKPTFIDDDFFRKYSVYFHRSECMWRHGMNQVLQVKDIKDVLFVVHDEQGTYDNEDAPRFTDAWEGFLETREGEYFRDY